MPDPVRSLYERVDLEVRRSASTRDQIDSARMVAWTMRDRGLGVEEITRALMRRSGLDFSRRVVRHWFAFDVPGWPQGGITRERAAQVKASPVPDITLGYLEAMDHLRASSNAECKAGPPRSSR